MRILHLLASPWWTGPAEAVALLALAQRRLGHEVSVAVDRLRTDAPSEEPSVPRLESLGLLDDSGLELSVKSSPSAMFRDIRRLRQTPADVVHAHFSHDHLVAWLASKGRTRLVRSVHAPRSVRRLMPGAHGWTVPYAELARMLMGQRILVLPPFVAPEFTRPAHREALRNSLGLEGDPLIGMVSTFQQSRRHDVGVAAFARLVERNANARLVLVGDGGLLDDVKADVAARGLSARVTFAGYRGGAEFVSWLQALDVVWILGLGNDWSGRAAAQAKACGVRVVSVDEGALASNADETSTLDPAELADATERVLARPEWSRVVRGADEIARDVVEKLYAP